MDSENQCKSIELVSQQVVYEQVGQEAIETNFAGHSDENKPQLGELPNQIASSVNAHNSYSKDNVFLIFQEYCAKFKGCKENPLKGKPLPYTDIVASTVVSFIGMLLVAVCHYHYLTKTFRTEDTHVAVGMLTAPMAASAGK